MGLDEDDDRALLEILRLGEVRKERRVLRKTHAQSVNEEEWAVLLEAVACGLPVSRYANEVTSVFVLDFSESMQLGRTYAASPSVQY